MIGKSAGFKIYVYLDNVLKYVTMLVHLSFEWFQSEKYLFLIESYFISLSFVFSTRIRRKDVAVKLDWAVNDYVCVCVTKCLLLSRATRRRRIREGFTTNRASEIMLHRSVRLHIIHVIARGNHELSRGLASHCRQVCITTLVYLISTYVPRIHPRFLPYSP